MGKEDNKQIKIRTMAKDIQELREGKLERGEKEEMVPISFSPQLEIPELEIKEEKKAPQKKGEDKKKGKKGGAEPIKPTTTKPVSSQRPKEETKKQMPPKAKSEKEVLEEKRTELEGQIAAIEEQLRIIPEKRRPFELQREQLVREKGGIETGELQPILEKERKIEEEKKKIELEERKAELAEKRRGLEKRRWEIEEERRAIEREKWKVEEKVLAIDVRIQHLDEEIEKVKAEEKLLVDKRDDILRQLAGINAQLEVLDLEETLSRLIWQREEIERERARIVLEIGEVEETLKEIARKEKEIEVELKALEEEEGLTKEISRQMEIEKERWRVEEERKETEQQRWELEDKKKELEIQQKAVELKYKEINSRIDLLEKRIRELRGKIPGRGEGEERMVEKEVKENMNEKEGEEGFEEVVPSEEETIPPFLRKKEVEEENSPPEEENYSPKEENNNHNVSKSVTTEPKGSIPEEKIFETQPEKFETQPGKEEIITTKEAIIEGLRSDEKPVEEDLPFKEKEEGTVREELERVVMKELGSTRKKPKPWTRLFVRLLVFLLLLFVVVLLIMFLFLKIKERGTIEKSYSINSSLEKKSEEKKEVASGDVVTEGQSFFLTQIPPSLLKVESEEFLEITEEKEASTEIIKSLKKNFPEETFHRLIIIKKPEERLLNLEEILQAFQIWFPQGLTESIENFTLGIYSQKTGNKIVLVAKIKEGVEIEDLVSNWQNKIEKEGVYLAGVKVATLTNKFQKITYQGKEIKFLTISRQDKGICYSLVKPYFIFAGSLEATKKIIDQIK